MRTTHRLDITYRAQFPADGPFAASKIATVIEDKQIQAATRAMGTGLVAIETVRRSIDEFSEGEFTPVIRQDRESIAGRLRTKRQQLFAFFEYVIGSVGIFIGLTQVDLVSFLFGVVIVWYGWRDRDGG